MFKLLAAFFCLAFLGLLGWAYLKAQEPVI